MAARIVAGDRGGKVLVAEGFRYHKDVKITFHGDAGDAFRAKPG